QALYFAFKDKQKQIFMSKVNKEKQFWKCFLKNLAPGRAAGTTSMCIWYLLDFAVDAGKGSEISSMGLGDCIIKIGFGVSLQRLIVYQASYFGCYDTIKVALTNKNAHILNLHGILKIYYELMRVFVAAFVFTLICAERVRHMMMQSRETECQYKGNVDCFMKIYERERLSAFFRGAFSNTLHGTRGAVVLVLYDKIKDIFNLGCFGELRI
uniref:ADP/ATP translocase n=1 Tax=Falco tinnunculus TaxID=100819 RepID=A0A8C4TYJ0_FALTI